jgi:hypothetical protein
MEVIRNASAGLVGTPERKRLLGRLSCKLEGNIKMDLKETGCEDDKLIILKWIRNWM